MKFAIPLAAAGALLLAACETMYEPPYAALDKAKTYGYSDRHVVGDTYEITYISPSQRVARSSAARRGAVAEQSDEARDMATWRAAELALEKGFPAFEVVDTRTDTEVSLRDYDYNFPSLFHMSHVYRYDRLYRDYYYPYGTNPSVSTAYASTRTILTVKMEKAAGENTKDAQATRDRLRLKYAAAQAAPSQGGE